MKTLTADKALQAVQQHANSNTITAATIEAMLQNTSVTFGQILHVTEVALAAKHKAESIKKVTSANVILCSNIHAHTSVYANRVKKTARMFPDNDPTTVEAFTPAQNYYEHTDCYSVVRHREHHEKLYLYAMYNPGVQSLYVHNGNIVEEQYVAQFMTPSGVKALLDHGPIHNKTHNIMHTVTVRTIALNNIVSIRARKQLVTV